MLTQRSASDRRGAKVLASSPATISRSGYAAGPAPAKRTASRSGVHRADGRCRWSHALHRLAGAMKCHPSRFWWAWDGVWC